MEAIARKLSTGIDVAVGDAFPLPIMIGDGAHNDSFSRLRVSTPDYVFDAQFTYDLQPLLFEQIVSGSGAGITHDTTDRNALLAFSNTASGGKAILQTYEHFRYQPGRSQLVYATFKFGEPAPGCMKFIGYSDGANGIELQMNGSQVRIAILSDTGIGDQFINQEEWGDPLDGTGPSRITVDWTKHQILAIDLQALYVGRVRCYLDIDGILVKFYDDLNANVHTSPYIQTANLPIRAGLSCTQTVTTSMRFNCCVVISEGGQNNVPGYQFSQEGTATAGDGTATHILSLRPRATFNGIVNRSKFTLEHINLMVTGSNPIKWQLVLGQAITGTTAFTSVNESYSAVEYNVAGTLSGSPAIVIDSGYLPAANQVKGAVSENIEFRYPITLDVAGATRSLGTLSLLVTGIGGSSACRASMNWKESR